MTALIKVYGPKGLVGICDERCYDSFTNVCNCCCGGANHGIGLNRAIGVTRNIYDSVILLHNTKVDVTLRVERPPVQPVLFDYQKERKLLPIKEKRREKTKNAIGPSSVEAQG